MQTLFADSENSAAGQVQAPRRRALSVQLDFDHLRQALVALGLWLASYFAGALGGRLS
jgi:hypothetical protein